MEKGKAMAIFTQINSEEYTDEEKALAIYMIMRMITHNSITKNMMLEVIKWLWNKGFEIVVAESAENE
ncbi:MAG: hypothetical protein IKB88_02110 [Clostridia bacterium]|nr:hypothetical protein [Clostridia bacterium]